MQGAFARLGARSHFQPGVILQPLDELAVAFHAAPKGLSTHAHHQVVDFGGLDPIDSVEDLLANLDQQGLHLRIV